MKRLIPVVFLLLPVALFAQNSQGPKERESAMLKQWGINDSQIAQVFDIQKNTRMTARQDVVQLRLLRAQMSKALLSANPNMQEVNGYIAQIAQTRADLTKAFVGARVQLRQIIGEDHFAAYVRFIMHKHRHWLGRRHIGSRRMHHQGPSGAMMQDRTSTMSDADDSSATGLEAATGELPVPPLSIELFPDATFETAEATLLPEPLDIEGLDLNIDLLAQEATMGPSFRFGMGLMLTLANPLPSGVVSGPAGVESPR